VNCFAARILLLLVCTLGKCILCAVWKGNIWNIVQEGSWFALCKKGKLIYTSLAAINCCWVTHFTFTIALSWYLQILKGPVIEVSSFWRTQQSRRLSPSPEDGKRASSRNVVFSIFFRKLKNAVIPNTCLCWCVCLRIYLCMLIRWAGHILPTFFFFGATAPIWALAYLHETLRFTSVF
jgi:hypothetical protein